MDQQKNIWEQTLHIALWEIGFSVLAVGVLGALDRFQGSVLFGTLIGCGVMICNYFFMAVTVSLAADRAEQGKAEQGKKMIRLSTVLRLAIMALVLFASIKLGADVLALLLPLALFRPALMLSAFFRKKRET